MLRLVGEIQGQEGDLVATRIDLRLVVYPNGASRPLKDGRRGMSIRVLGLDRQD